MRIRRLLLPLVTVALLAGCTGTHAPAPETTSKPAAQPGSPEPAAPAYLVLDAGTVVATGSLTSVDGLTTGSVVIAADGRGEYTLDIPNLSTPLTEEVIVNYSSRPFTEEAYCANGFMVLVQGHLTLGPSLAEVLNFTYLTLGNPDFLDTLLLTSNDPAAPKTGCFYPVIASAALTWTMPDLRPDIHVVDSGSTGGATGTVAATDGRPTSYTVAPGDVLTEIAARLGVTAADLFYLNPGRTPSPQDPTAYAGEVFNLDKHGR